MSLRIQTERWEISLDGEARPSVWESSGGRQPRLRVKAGNHDRIELVTVDGESYSTGAHFYEGPGPRIAEETNYRLSVVSLEGQSPTLDHLDPSLIRHVLPIPGHGDVLSGNINFRSQVGDSRFVITDEDSELELVIEVRPSKLDYETDYEELLESVGLIARQLVFEFVRATTRGAQPETSGNNRRIEWLLLLREVIEGLELALKHIVSSPYRTLSREIRTIPAERIRHPSAQTRRAVIRGGGMGRWEQAEGVGRHRAKLPASQAYETLDNLENRWLRTELEHATQTLAQLGIDFASRQRAVAGKQPNLRTRAIAEELAKMEETLTPFLAMSPFTEAASWVPKSYASLTLQGRPGYREAYAALLQLNKGLIVGGDALSIPMRDLSELYEIWCFLAVINRVSELLAVPVDLSDLVELRDDGVRLTVVPGKQSVVKLTTGWCEARVIYNRAYRMSSGTQRPDIVIEIRRKDLPPVLLLLDAKYRVDTSPEYVRDYGCPGPPADAIGQLHRYRDAIIVKYPRFPKGRPVVRGVALFPFSKRDSETWCNHSYCKSIEEVGIGALPFLPSNTELVDEWLRDSVMASPNRLAWPGPDFIAWADKARSSQQSLSEVGNASRLSVDIVYWIDGDSVVFTERDRAEHVSQIRKALNESRTWGELRRNLPTGEWETHFQPNFDKSKLEVPLDDEPFEIGQVLGNADGDYPALLAHERVDWLPPELIKKYGGDVGTSFPNCEFRDLPAAKAEQLAEDLRAMGLAVERADMEF